MKKVGTMPYFFGFIDELIVEEDGFIQGENEFHFNYAFAMFCLSGIVRISITFKNMK